MKAANQLYSLVIGSVWRERGGKFWQGTVVVDKLTSKQIRSCPTTYIRMVGASSGVIAVSVY